jgi:DNA-nicking Smr family endonuclease
MKALDLHGTKHREADEKVRRFLNFAPLPCQIITGNSPEMKGIVESIVKEYEWFCYERDSYNCGTLIILENSI